MIVINYKRIEITKNYSIFVEFNKFIKHSFYNFTFFKSNITHALYLIFVVLVWQFYKENNNLYNRRNKQ